jgi:pimeloyl-ACP methyl ester carboxylesterase
MGLRSHSLLAGGSPVSAYPLVHARLLFEFLRAEIERMARPPVLMGHSMGGALTQWYLKYAGDLPAAVLVAPWSSHGNIWDGLVRFSSLDPLGTLLIALTVTATPMIRTPQRAARMFITEGAALTPEELHAQLGPESWFVIANHFWPWWRPRQDV